VRQRHKLSYTKVLKIKNGFDLHQEFLEIWNSGCSEILQKISDIKEAK